MFACLNAKDFGVPQNRERLYIISVNNKLCINTFNFPNYLNIPTSLSTILKDNDIVNKKYTISDKLWSSHKERKKKHAIKGNGFGYKLFNKNSTYTSTLSARYYKDGSEILIKQKEGNPRKLTPTECARLMGFPMNFQIPVPDNQAYKQFGNSVCVSLVREIAKLIVEML